MVLRKDAVYVAVCVCVVSAAANAQPASLQPPAAPPATQQPPTQQYPAQYPAQQYPPQYMLVPAPAQQEPRVHWYLEGGYSDTVGATFGGYYCDPFVGFCGGGFGEVNVASHTVTKFGWNAGMGIDFPLGIGTSFFIEGRYNRIRVSNASTPIEFVPITIGLRF
ncbi:MAG: hypothetical protein ACLP2F_03545 [Steroidobacteraceae bacterium]